MPKDRPSRRPAALAALPPSSLAAFGLAGLGLLVAALVAAGVVAGPPPGADRPPRPAPVDASPVAARLRPFDGCAALRDWYVEHARRDVTAYGWGGWPLYALDTVRGSEASTPAAGSATGQASSATGTNTQEADVDEPDLVKTDGRWVVRVHGRALVVTDTAGGVARELARLDLPSGLDAGELLLVGDHAVVLSAEHLALPLGGPAALPGDPGPASTSTRVADVDLSTPGAPKLLADRTYPGSLVTARQYGDVVRLVTDVGRPALPFVEPGHGLGRSAALGRNRALVEQSTLSDWLPGIRDNLTGGSSPAVDCAAVYHPGSSTGTDTILVSGFRPGSADSAGTAVTAAGELVYSSAARLYVTAADWAGDDGWARARSGSSVRTDVHAFRLDGVGATYVGSGSVPGTVRDRWSMDEHDGDLRVAVTRTGRGASGRTDNGVVVLAERGGGLATVGRVWGLGRDEDLQAVRWFDDLAVLVTFRQTDPLHTVDLTDPAAPRALGALELPGYSGYLHPIGDARLLGVGVNATATGEQLGAQAAVFDVHDLADPRRLGRVGFGRWSEAEVCWEPRALAWLPGEHAALTVLRSWSPVSGRSRAEVHLLRVGPTGGLTDRVVATTGGGPFRALPLADGRVALVDARVRVLDRGLLGHVEQIERRNGSGQNG